jgi:hypothetical protein
MVARRYPTKRPSRDESKVVMPKPLLRRLFLGRNFGDRSIGNSATGDLPRSGDYFSFRTSPALTGTEPTGHYAALKIIETNEDFFAYAVLDGIWNAPPTLRNAREAAILKLRAFRTAPDARIEDDIFRCWWWGWKPKDIPEMRLLGNDPVTSEERAALAHSLSFTGLGGAAVSAEREWRWPHDRDRLLKDVKRSETEYAIAAAKEARRKRERRKTLTWDQLLAEDPFPNWKPYPSETFAAEARTVVQDACHALKALGPKPPRSHVRVILRGCVEWFSPANERYGDISSEQRREIVNVLQEMAYLSGHRSLTDDFRLWRGW